VLFQSLQFAVFFVIVYSLYVFLPFRWQNKMLLVASYVFYGAWDWRYLSLILLSTATDYMCGIGITASKNKAAAKRFVTLSIVVNLSLLGVFKYFDFFSTNFQVLMGNFGLHFNPFLLDVALPIGISFYTFQTMSYTIDVYRKKVPAVRNPLDFALYVSYFPQLVAGPIERGTRLLPQILKPRVIEFERAYQGAYLMLWGLFLKVFIADNLAKMVDPVYSATAPYDGAAVLLATYAFSIQIYADFAGYSFMAIGMARMMGIELMENFRRPYFSKNIGDFWRRWHISLSSWFRDYVFSPFYMYIQRHPRLKKFPMRTRHLVAFFGALVVAEYMLGLWHGAGWNFGFFGLFHALMIGVYYMTRQYWDRMNIYVQIIITFHIACVGWLIFRAPTLNQAGAMFRDLFLNFSIENSTTTVDEWVTMLGLVSILFTVQLVQEWRNDVLAVLQWPRVARDAFFVLLVVLIASFGEFGGRPFIYFQF
jgi:alginate O-acetyltransferase complex protein AlgI